MKYFCYIDSEDNLSTNLQLYSLKKAAEVWNELVDDVNKTGVEGVINLTERLTFILNCLGLSLAQLVGQNCPSPNKSKMDQVSYCRIY